MLYDTPTGKACIAHGTRDIREDPSRIYCADCLSEDDTPEDEDDVPCLHEWVWAVDDGEAVCVICGEVGGPDAI